MPSTTSFPTREQYEEAVTTALAAAQAYYNTDELVLDDATYDAILAQLIATESEHPEWRRDDSPVGKVAAGVATPTDPAGAASTTVAHTVPMLSLDNVFGVDELASWAANLERHLGRPVARYAVEPKLDGLAISARYEDGALTRIVTRGDGETGEDVTYAATNIRGLPAQLRTPATIEVRGEVLLTDKQFETANELRIAHGDKPFVNPRNGAAGALLGAKDRAYQIPLTFFCYSMIGEQDAHSDAMAWVAELGVQTTAARLAGLTTYPTITGVANRITELAELRPMLGFAIDGAVIKADLATDQRDGGFSSRAPRWAIAYKYPADSAISTLEEVIWQVGRTGVITPRARITPTFVGGTTIEYATLHNPDDLARKGFLLGDKVTVLRAGEVIPRLEAPVTNLRTGDEQPITLPTSCPRCGAGIDKSQARWRCEMGRDCALTEVIEYAVARDCLDIEGLGEKHVIGLVESKLVTDIGDLFTLTADDLLTLDRMGESNTEKILAEIDRARGAKLSRVFCALGIRGTGRSMSRRIARHFNTMEAIRAADVHALCEVDGIGPEKAPVIVAELATLAPVVDKLIAAGVNMVEDPARAAAQQTGEPAVTSELPLAGKKVCVSGTVPGLSRTEAAEAVEELGGTSSGSVSKNTDLLVAGPGAGSKLAKAESLGVNVMDAADFAALVATHRG